MHVPFFFCVDILLLDQRQVCLSVQSDPGKQLQDLTHQAKRYCQLSRGQLKEGWKYSCLEDAALCKTLPELLSLEALLQPNSQPPKCKAACCGMSLLCDNSIG